MPADDHESRSSFRVAAIALALALLGSVSMLYYHLGLFIPRTLEHRASLGLGNGYAFGDDFYPVWLTVRQWRADHRDPYSPAMTREIQTGLFGRPLDPSNPADPPPDYREFTYPAFTELILWPAAALDFPKLRFVLAAFLPLLTAASFWLWLLALNWRVSPIWIAILTALGLCNYQILEALFAEQPGLIVGFLLAAAALALGRNRVSLAGVLLALTLIKPQMTSLAIVFLLLWSFSDRRRAGFWMSFLATTLFLLSASLWIWPHWIGQWLKILLGYHRYATPPLVALLPGATLGAYIGPAALVLALGVSAVLAWRGRHANADTPGFWLTLSLLLAITSVTLLPGQAIYDDVILLPGIFLLLRHWREIRSAGLVPRTLLTVGALIFFWPWAAAFALVVMRPLLPPTVFESTAVFALPIRTAASLPFAVLALLAYAAKIKLSGIPEAA
jgi:hypothetical protein